jgi:uncharacterized protein YjbI with pentapeptide repeats
VDCGLNVQLRTPSLCPNRGRARPLEAHGYYWRSHIRGPHQRHDTDLRGGGNRLYQLYQCAIPLRWTENRRSSNLRLSAGEPEKPFQFSRGNLLLQLRLVSVSAQSATGNRIKDAQKNHLGLIQQGVDAWNTWRERAAAQLDLSRADLTKADLREADLRKANLYKANLSEADLSKANLGGANLVSAYRGGTIFTSADLDLADFSGAFLGGADVRGATLVKADLQHAVLDDANFGGANLSQADLSVAKCSRANLSGANLSGAFLGEAYFGQANLSGADFSEAYLGGADLSWANLSGANFSGANLSGAILEGATLIETNLENADLNGCRIYGISAWNIKANQETKQTSLIIAPRGEASITVDDIQVAQFIHLIVKYENLRTVLNTVTKRGVLILGRFGGGGLQVLREVAEALRQCGYLPMIFDFERPEGRNYTETVRTLAGLARFVVVDLSGPSVPQELYATVPHLKIPFVPILEKGRRPYAMFVDLLEYEWVLKPIVEFDSTSALIQELQDQIVSPAEKRIEMRQAKLKELFG